MKFLGSLMRSPVLAAVLFLCGIAAVANSQQVYLWSQTPGTNSNADPSINWATGMAPSAVSPSARGMMAGVAKVRDDWSGANATGGNAAAYTLSSNQVFGSLSQLNNQKICFTASATNTAGPTLAVDGLTAWPISSAPSTPIGAGVLVLGSPYCVVYNNSNHEFYLHDFYGNPFSVPLGVVLDYTGASAPNSNFALAFGQAISRTTYAGYFSLVGTTFGTGDGVTTFNIPDLRGRITPGLDNMGGVSANRLSTCATNTTMGGSCGVQSQTIVQANLPNISLSPSSLTLSISGGATNVCNGGGCTNGNNSFFTSSVVSAQVNLLTDVSTTQSPYTFSFGGSVPLGGSGTALPTVQPGLMLNKLVRIF